MNRMTISDTQLKNYHKNIYLYPTKDYKITRYKSTQIREGLMSQRMRVLSTESERHMKLFKHNLYQKHKHAHIRNIHIFVYSDQYLR